MKIITLLVLMALTFPSLTGQVKSIQFNPVENQLNSGIDIPSEEPFTLGGVLPDGIRMVVVRIYKDNRFKSLLYEYNWKIPYQYNVNRYDLFITEPLKSNSKYSFQILYYRVSSTDEVTWLKDALSLNTEAYIRSNYEATRTGISSMTPEKVFIDNLNKIIIDGTENYIPYTHKPFNGFSDLLVQKVEQIDNARLNKARFNILQKEDATEDKALYAEKLVNELVDLAKAELAEYITADLLPLADQREIVDVQTESRPTYLPINIGYGGVYFDGGFKNLDYGTSPYIGVSLPLGNKTFHRFLGNASLSTGVMLNNLQNGSGEEISGPFINRPFYAGLGYNMFKIMRFNAGAAVLSKQTISSREEVFLMPFAGLSIEFNLWVGFTRK